MNTCRSLQSLISMNAQTDIAAIAPSPSLAQLPTPPLTYAPSPIKLRLRSRTTSAKLEDWGEEGLGPRRRIVRRAPPRGANKRRRPLDDEMIRDDVDFNRTVDSDSDSDLETGPQLIEEEKQAPSTPKRARIAPEQLPLGLERSDFHDVHLRESGTVVEPDKPSTEWSAEDDRILVELVLEKLKLSKTEWQDCARSLGKDRHTVSRRWKSLIMHGDVGVKTRSSSRRTKLHSTWR